MHIKGSEAGGEAAILGCILSLTLSCPPQAWVQERLPLAMQTERGNGLQAVQQHIKKNQVS